MNHQRQQEKLPANQLSSEDADASDQPSTQQVEAHQYSSTGIQGQLVFSLDQNDHGPQGFMPTSQERDQMDERQSFPFHQFIHDQALDQINDQSSYPIEPLQESRVPQAPIPQPSSSTGYAHQPQTNRQYARGQQPAGDFFSASLGLTHAYGNTIMRSPNWNNPGHSEIQQPTSPEHIDLLNLNNTGTSTHRIDLLNLGNIVSHTPTSWPNSPTGHEPVPAQPSAQSGYSSFPTNSAMQTPVNPQQQPAQLILPFQQPLAAPQASPAASNTQVGNPMGNARAPRIRSRPGAWTPEEVHQAQQMRENGFTDKQIAEALNRSESAVVAKLWREEGNNAHASYTKRKNGGRAAR